MALIPGNCTTDQDGLKVRPLISVYVQEESGGDFFPVGCCITRFSPPKLTRESVVDDSCINLLTDCETGEPTGECNKPPKTQPGQMGESEFSFLTNWVPGGLLNEFFETAQKCGTSYQWVLCYANGKRQLIPDGFVKAVEPEDFEPNAKSAAVNITVSIGDEWLWEDSGAPFPIPFPSS